MDGPPRSEIFVKDCGCPRSTATANETRITISSDGDNPRIVATFTPGPSCDTCGRPWRLQTIAEEFRGFSVGYVP